MISPRQPFRLWELSRQLGLGPAATGNLFGSYYFGRRSGFKKFFPPTVVIDIPRWGKIPIRTNGYDFGLLAQIFIREDYRLEVEDPSQIRRILDLGANIGMAAVYFNRQYPEATIACVEPSIYNTPLLKQAMAINKIRGRVFEAAIGADEGTVDLYLSDQPDCNSVHRTDDSYEVIRVPQVSVPHVLEQMGWNGIDLLKIDIEGAEKYVLGQNNSWLRGVRIITGEGHINAGYSYRQMERDLNAIGFTLDVLISETEEYGASFRGVNTQWQDTSAPA